MIVWGLFLNVTVIFNQAPEVSDSEGDCKQFLRITEKPDLKLKIKINGNNLSLSLPSFLLPATRHLGQEQRLQHSLLYAR